MEVKLSHINFHVASRKAFLSLVTHLIFLFQTVLVSGRDFRSLAGLLIEPSVAGTALNTALPEVGGLIDSL
jgi:hypothetical protein